MNAEELVEESVLSRLAEMTEPLEDSRFKRIGNAWVYFQPLAIDRKYREDEIDFIDFFTRDLGALTRFNLPEQIMLQDMIRERTGRKIRHGSFEENFNAICSKETAEYVENVLKGHHVFTGELGRKGEPVRMIKGINKKLDAEVPVEETQILVFDDGLEIYPEEVPMKKTTQIQYVIDRSLSRRLPSKSGYFDSFKVLPADEDLKDKGQHKWLGTNYDKNNLSAVLCCGYEGEGKFMGATTTPLFRDYNIVIPVWTDEAPKK